MRRWGKKVSPLYEWRAKYERYITLTLGRKTVERYVRAMEQFFARFPEKLSPTDFARADIEDYRLMRLKEGISPITVNYLMQVVHGFFAYLHDLEAIPYNPASKIKRLREPEPIRKAYTPEEQLRLYQTAAATNRLQNQLLVGLALGTGLRGETLVKLEKADVDFEGKALRVPGTKMKKLRAHEIPVRESELALLAQAPDGLLFGTISAVTLSVRFNRLCKRAQVPSLGLRGCRRTFATTLLRSGVDLRTVQTLLGHTNIATTSRYIVPADQQQMRDALAKLPQ